MRHSPLASRRTAIYQWFSQLLFQELSEAQLVALDRQESRAWIASLSAIPGLASDVKRFERSLTRVLQRAARTQELAADFASLFCWRRLWAFRHMPGITLILRQRRNGGR